METVDLSLEHLVHRLQNTPSDFLAEPIIAQSGVIDTVALVADLYRAVLADPLARPDTAHFRPDTGKARNYLRLVLIVAWLLHDEWFRDKPDLLAKMTKLFDTQLKDLAVIVEAEKFVNDPDRREELARFCMSKLDLLPAGETQAQAAAQSGICDRL